MHRTIEYVIECADPNCTARVVTTSHKKNVLCPECREERRRARNQRRAAENAAKEKAYDPDTSLNKKLETAEYCILHDAGPPEESFPYDARFTREELNGLLDNAYLAPGSLVFRRSCGDVLLVTRCRQTAKLHLKLIRLPPRI
jgi:hypothetical protein